MAEERKRVTITFRDGTTVKVVTTMHEGTENPAEWCGCDWRPEIDYAEHGLVVANHETGVETLYPWDSIRSVKTQPIA